MGEHHSSSLARTLLVPPSLIWRGFINPLYCLLGDTHLLPLSSKLQEGATSDAMRLVGNGFSDQLTDFDNHLDNVLLDWTNPDINQALSSGGN